MRIGRLFVGSKQCNEPDRYVIASWEYVTGYWRWALYRSPWRSWQLKFSGSYKNGFSPHGGWRHPFGCYLCTPLLGAFSLSTQPPLPAMKRWGTRA